MAVQRAGPSRSRRGVLGVAAIVVGALLVMTVWQGGERDAHSTVMKDVQTPPPPQRQQQITPATTAAAPRHDTSTSSSGHSSSAVNAASEGSDAPPPPTRAAEDEVQENQAQTSAAHRSAPNPTAGTSVDSGVGHPATASETTTLRNGPPVKEFRRWLIGAWPKVDLDPLRAVYKHLYKQVKQLGVEGHSGQLKKEPAVYTAIARRPEVKRICEIGFNSGHSASTWLLANPTAEVLMFDLWAHSYAPKAEAWLRSDAAAATGLHNVSARLRIVKGSSLETVPQFFAENPGVKCNILSVDGGHTFEIATRDIRSMRMLADPDFHVLLIDDTNCEPHFCVDPVVDEHVSRGSIRRILGYAERWDEYNSLFKRGVTVLQYVLDSPIWAPIPAVASLRYGSFRDVDVSGYLELRAKLVTAVPDAAPTAGGDAPELPLRRGVYAQLARMPGVRRVCLLGFQHAPHAGGEGGHPALLWLWANPAVEVLLFESDASGVVAAEAWLGSDAAAAAGLRNASARVERVSGPSNQVLMDYIGQHPDVQCDVIAVDGGRGTTQRDLRHLRYYARSEANLLAVEDTNCEQAYCVDTAIEGLQRQGELTPPLLSLTEGDGAHGITVLSYT